MIFFTAVNLAKLPPYAALGLLDASGLVASLALRAVRAARVLGRLAAGQVLPEPVFHRLLVGSLLLIGVKLLWDAFFG